MLVHHANTRCQSSFGVTRGQRLAKRMDVAAVGGVMAKQDRHQSRLASAVFAQQRQDFAMPQFQRNGIVGHQCAKALGDAIEGQDSLGQTVCLLGGRLGLTVVHLDGELACHDVRLFGLDLGDDVSRHFFVKGAQRG